jgi:hypothetical protein
MSDRLPGIRPRPSLSRRLDIMARSSFPATTTALMLLIADAPLGLPGQAELQLSVVFASVFFWSLFRPASMPPPVVFLLGLLTDLLGYAPPGVGVLTLLVTHGLALLAGRAGLPRGVAGVRRRRHRGGGVAVGVHLAARIPPAAALARRVPGDARRRPLPAARPGADPGPPHARRA